jgi:hypothetical protein
MDALNVLINKPARFAKTNKILFSGTSASISNCAEKEKVRVTLCKDAKPVPQGAGIAHLKKMVMVELNNIF